MKESKLYPILLFIVLFILISNLIITLYEYNDYQKRVESGNARWKQVEKRIKEIERCCNSGRDN